MRTITSSVSLTAALRGNLLSLQSTQSLVDSTQLRLATGLKVTSALDNPQNFFVAQSLNNRASDLGFLLDGISQSIRTIEEADNGVGALTKLVEQADSIVQSARNELATAEKMARAVGNIDLRAVMDLTAFASIDNGDKFQIITTDADGLQVLETITFATGDSVYSFAAKITNQFADNENSEILARVTDAGFISIESLGGRSFRIVDGNVGSGNEVSDAGFDALGLGDYFENEFSGGDSRSAATIVAGNTISSVSLYESTGDLVDAGDTLVGSTFQDADGNTVISGFSAGNWIFSQGNTDSGTTFSIFVIQATTTFQDLVDQINQDTSINQFVNADFDSSTGQLSFTSLGDALDSFGVGVLSFGGSLIFDISLGDATGNLDPITQSGFFLTLESRVFSFSNSSDELDNLADDYNIIREHIDQLVFDAGYSGINLLGNDNLTTFFNEDNTSSLITAGADFTANGLGLTTATFGSSSQIELAATQVRDALALIRGFGSTLANNLSIIQTRRNFTESTINTLKAGADDLVLANQNEEGANLLALQTRQALGITSLSLAAQSQQAVLRLF